jgi:hypothetical protein
MTPEFTHIATQRQITGNHIFDIPGLKCYETTGFWVGENGRKYRKKPVYRAKDANPRHADGGSSWDSRTELVDIIPISDHKASIFASKKIQEEFMSFVEEINDQDNSNLPYGNFDEASGWFKCAYEVKSKLEELEK